MTVKSMQHEGEMSQDTRFSVTQRIAKLTVQIDAKISTICDLP